MADTNPLKTTTGEVRFSYTKYLATPEIKQGDSGPYEQYSCCLLIPKSDKATIDKIKAVIEKAKVDPKFTAKWGGKFLPSMKTGLRDGDTDRDTDKGPEYAGHYFINVNTFQKPGIVNRALEPIIDKSELYSGFYGRASISAGAYNTDGNKGIKWYLSNVQKLRDGDVLGGGNSRPEDDFTAVTDDFLS